MALIFGFLIGLAVGLSLWLWRQSHYEAKLRTLLAKLNVDSWTTALSAVSQLSIAISDSQRQLAALEQHAAAYHHILQAAPIGYLQVDEENRLLWCNAQAYRLLGFQPTVADTTPSKAVNRAVQPKLLLQLVRSYELDQLIDRTRQDQQSAQIEWILHTASPDPVSLSDQRSYPLRGYSVPLERGQVGVFLENRQEAVRLIQQRDRWTSDVAHELKTPLTSIRLVAETLKARIDPSLHGWIDRLLNETIRLSNLVEDLLNLSRLEGDDFQGLSIKSVDFPQLVQKAWQSLEPLARVKHLSLTYVGPHDCLVQLDESLMHRVLINVLDNAIKHSPPREPILVGLTVNDPQAVPPTPDLSICLEIVDSGSGFPVNDLPYIFDRFYRADPSRTRSTFALGSQTPNSDLRPVEPSGPGGSGLGLAIVKHIVEAHQGRIVADNHPDTGGAWVKVYLPNKLLVKSLPLEP